MFPHASLNCLPRLVTALVMTGALLASLTLVIAGPAVAAPAARAIDSAQICPSLETDLLNSLTSLLLAS
jgi:hypothetical protein